MLNTGGALNGEIKHKNQIDCGYSEPLRRCIDTQLLRLLRTAPASSECRNRKCLKK